MEYLQAWANALADPQVYIIMGDVAGVYCHIGHEKQEQGELTFNLWTGKVAR